MWIDRRIETDAWAVLERYADVPGPSGIRAQAVAADGTLVDDFWFESLPRVLLVRGTGGSR